MRSLIIALLLSSSCFAQGFTPNRLLTGHDDGAGRSMYNRGRMPELPTGPNKLDCWIVVSDQWQSNKLEYSIAQAIATDPRMQQIKKGTYFNYYTVNDAKFRSSGLVSAVGTATPICVVMAHDGAIRADGTGGLFVNAKSCPQSADEIVDMLCDAIAQANPPPVVEGQTNATQIVRESSAPCPGPDCAPTPVLTPALQPHIDGTLSPIRPVSKQSYALAGMAVLAACGIAALGAVAVVHHQLKAKP